MKEWPVTRGATFQDQAANGTMPGSLGPVERLRLRILRLTGRRNGGNQNHHRAKETMAKRLGQVVPRTLRSFVKDRYLARKYPMLTFGKEVNIKESSFGRHTQIADRVNIFHCNIGDYSYIEVGTVAAYANIGKFCSIAGGTYIGLGVHPTRQFLS